MDVEGSKIVSIGEIQEPKNGRKKLSITVNNPTGVKTYVIIENNEPNFDLVRKFERGIYKPGQTIDFNFNKAIEGWQFDMIWKIKVREQPNERG